ncbi:MAG: hypothetical protein AAGB34_06770 [Planctomycetota bacterium]
MPTTKRDLTARTRTWFGKMRLRFFTLVVGIPAAAVIVAITLSPPSWLIVGATVAAVTVGVNHATRNLAVHRCYSCGSSIENEEPCEAGIICPSCGSLNQHHHTT